MLSTTMIPRRSSRLASLNVETKPVHVPRRNEVNGANIIDGVHDVLEVLEQQYLDLQEENKDLKSENEHLKYQMASFKNGNKDLLEEVHILNFDLHNCAQIGGQFEQKNIYLNKKVKVLEERLRLAELARENLH